MKEIETEQKYIHLLADRLTPKTNCGMRLKLLRLIRKKKQLSNLCQQVVSFSQHKTHTILSLEDLMSLDVSCLHSGDIPRVLSQEFRLAVVLCSIWQCMNGVSR